MTAGGLTVIVDALSSYGVGGVVTAFVCITVRDVLRNVLRSGRERQALTLAPAVYAAGGDPAAVIRALEAKDPS